MKIPHRFTLLGEEWRVSIGWTGPQPWRGFRWNPKTLHGLCVFEPRNGWRLIIVKPGLSRQARAEAFAHELLHAAAWEARFQRLAGWRGRELPHSVIDRLEAPLAAFLLENAASFGVRA